MCPLLLRRKSILDTFEPIDVSKLERSVDEVAEHIPLAHRYVSKIDIPATSEEHAIIQLVKQDVPMLLAEVLRVRPELRRAFEMRNGRR